MKQDTGINSSEVRARNMRGILRVLLHHDDISRVAIAEKLGLSTATITHLVTELTEQGLVSEQGALRKEGAGRPQVALRLVSGARLAVGIRIGARLVQVGLTDLKGQPLQFRAFSHTDDKSPEAVLSETCSMVEALIAEQGADRRYVIGVGVGAAGLVDPYTGMNVFAPNLGWRNVPLRDFLAERLRLPVCVDNNVRAMALGEAMFGVAQNVRAMAFAYARIGVGAGLVVEGELYRGAAAGAGEIGHTTMIVEGGERCHCGNTGCLETVFSETALVRLAGGQPIEAIFATARAGDQDLRCMLEDRARYMGVALANLVNVFNPELIVMGGILAQAEDLLMPTIEAVIRERAFADLGQQVVLRITEFGNKEGVIGAAALALEQFFYGA